ncbi:MAG: universal stress protein [Candidatus Nanopelagicales bacterium]
MSDVVVVGFLRSPEGEAAIAAAVEETRRRSGRLVVVHSSKGGAEDAESVVEDRLALDALGEELRADGLDVDIENLARGKDPAEDLIEIANREDASLIVIGMRRRSPVGKLLLGSNAQTLLLHADCPVLAVKAAHG